MAKKKEKVEIIQCRHCRYYHPLEGTAEGIYKVSPYRAYRKMHHSCERAVRKVGDKE